MSQAPPPHLTAASPRRRPTSPPVFPGDLVAGISVALGVIPQSLAYAALAGMPAVHGLYAAALPSIAAAFFVSSRYLQTGPAAVSSLMTLGALAPLALTASADYVKLAALLALVVGVARVALGVMRFGVVAYLMSEPVLLGFVSAAALLIAAAQVPAALGLAGDPARVVGRAVEALAHPAAWDPASPVLAAATVAIILLGRRVHPLVPGVLIAAVGGILFSRLTDYAGPVTGVVQAGLPSLSLDLPWTRLPQLIVPGLAIAIVGFAEPAAIGRSLAARDRERWDPNREFVSQGVANLAAGVVGAFPVGGSFSRSNLNRLAGARTRWAGVVTGAGVLAFGVVAGVLAPLPRAVLAGFVIASVVELIRVKALLRIWRLARLQAAVGVATFVLTLVLAPHIEQAILLGILLAVAAHLYREIKPEVRSWADGEVLHVAPKGVAFFGSVPAIEEALLDALAAHREAKRVILHMEGLGRVDLTGALLLRELVQDMSAAGLAVEFVDVPAHARKVLGRVLGWETSTDRG